MQVINWNISYMGNIESKIAFLMSKIKSSFCVILQEVKPNSFIRIENKFKDKANLIYSLDYRLPSKFDSEARKLGVLLLVSNDIEIINSGVVERNIFPDRTIYATLKIEDKIFRVLGLHSITGCGYFKAKSIQYDCLTEFIDSFNPDIIGIDANEPEVDSFDISQMKFYNNGNGAENFFEKIKSLNLVDSYVDYHKMADNNLIPKSHYVKRKGFVRYDFLFIKRKYLIEDCQYIYEEAINAGSDHSLINCEIKI